MKFSIEHLIKKIFIIFLGALFICSFFLSPAKAAEQTRLRINCSLHSAYEVFFFRLLEEVCARNNIQVQRNTAPAGRALLNVNQGIDDGDGPRIAGLSVGYPNLVMVSEPFGFFTFGAFSKNKNLSISNWSSLSKLNVAYIHGWKIFDNHVFSAKCITKVKNIELLFGLLTKGRTDVVLLSKLAGMTAIKRMNLKGIFFIEPALATVPNYLYLHKRHQNLVPKLAKTLSELKTDGTYQRLYKEIVSPYFSQ